MTVVIATNNSHKVRELSRILPRVSLIEPAALGVRFSYPERGRTFLANALGKAQHCLQLVSSQCDYPVLADDSGICVDALGGAPGVYSARFGRWRGVKDDEGRNALLLKRLAAATAPASSATESTHKISRAAHYVCAAVLVDAQQRIFVVQDRWDGSIAHAPSSGQNGFGYDPIFIPDESSVTVAEISDDEKDRHSHRGKAFRSLMKMYAEAC